MSSASPPFLPRPLAPDCTSLSPPAEWKRCQLFCEQSASSVHKRAYKAADLLSRKFSDEAITWGEIGAEPRCAEQRKRERERGVTWSSPHSMILFLNCMRNLMPPFCNQLPDRFYLHKHTSELITALPCLNRHPMVAPLWLLSTNMPSLYTAEQPVWSLLNNNWMT